MKQQKKEQSAEEWKVKGKFSKVRSMVQHRKADDNAISDLLKYKLSRKTKEQEIAQAWQAHEKETENKKDAENKLTAKQIKDYMDDKINR